MNRRAIESRRAAALATLRLQYPDTLSAVGVRPLHPRTGDPYPDDERHLVATCRSVSNFAIGALLDGPDWCQDAANRALECLHPFRATDGSGYHRLVASTGEPTDRTRSAYGHAFVLLAYARATDAGIDGARDRLEHAADLIDDEFRDAGGLIRSDCDPDWTEREPYRGQNANMHACEAFLAAHEATDDIRHLERAGQIAERIAVELATETDGLLWEHYTDEWEHDFAYNRDRPHHQFRPPGYQPGHHVEWAKLLALLDRYDDANAPPDGWYERATELFDAAVDLGWTGDGFAYTVDADGATIVSDRYGWALAEGIGAAAALAERASAHGDVEARDRFLSWESRFLECADEYRGPAGLWYEKRLADAQGGDLLAPEPPVVEPDYHPVTAFFESWRSRRAIADSR
ncbi:AGE family epimerase/isomerase [Natrarchaeobius oligotrophus]|uniref:N-acylglucosamine 2-epimerase n=1 Tax=Natrarchaeobius chitinivorans TaxID=1679083 RepID=A0A3N6PKQ8_NATCH|nr:AGE family epimerase/isomerase [Natrarchaeobius chitinivorans]RQG99395.1 N-acylglucosamine 2-epimerase [Natrarchaeobius chitinivorans]